MPKIKISVDHKLNQDDALKRLRNFVNNLKNDYGSKLEDIEESWNGSHGEFSFSAMGLKIKGSLSVLPSSVESECDLPMMALPFKDTIQSTIKEELVKVLN